MDDSNTKPRWPQFSLRSMLIFISLCAVLFGFLATVGREIAFGFLGLVFAGILVCALVSTTRILDLLFRKMPFAITAVLTSFLYFVLVLVFHLFGGAIDQPHPVYVQGNWFTHRLGESIFWALLFAVLMLIIVSVDSVVQYVPRHSGRRDTAYYPQLGNVRRSLSLPEGRLVLVVGFAFLVGYYALTVLEVWSSQLLPTGLVWPPERVFVSCMVVWSLLWIADCLSRPRRGTLCAAIGFLLCTLFFTMPVASYVLRE